MRLTKKFFADLISTRNRVPISCAENEGTINALSKEVKIPRTTLQTWKDRRWLHVIRQMPGIRGQIIYWANAQELDRLRRLRQTKWHFGDPSLPEHLTKPLIDASSE